MIVIYFSTPVFVWELLAIAVLVSAGCSTQEIRQNNFEEVDTKTRTSESENTTANDDDKPELAAKTIAIKNDMSEAPITTEKLDHVILLDVQGLWGGRDLWISADGKSFCRFVTPSEQGEPGLHEIRYEFVVSDDQLSSLLKLINEHSWFSIHLKDRYGVPDEARPGILIKSGSQEHAVGKWADDKHKDFDPIYQFLLEIAESGKKGTELSRGKLDWNWVPDGFPASKGIWKKTSPEISED